MPPTKQIVEANGNDKSLFYKIVRKQRKTNIGPPDHMMFGDTTVMGTDLPPAWADYFEDLATPVNRPEFDEEHYQSVVFQNELTRILAEREKGQHTPVLTSEVADIVNKLKTGKASDVYGLSAEHLQFAHPSLVDAITLIINEITENSQVPQALKMGLVTPVYKKKKSALDPNNYRRITVTPIVGKILEKIIVKPLKTTIAPQISKLQRGFCDHSSSSNTAFLLSEAIAEAQDEKIPLFAALLDASKAFDVVWHAGMHATISQMGINGRLWTLYVDLYDNMKSKVKSADVLSREIEEKQGVRQGGIPSTDLFKSRGNRVLLDLEDSGLGFTIGTVDVSAPTCADDMILLAQSPIALQRMLKIAEVDASQERYQFSNSKTKVMIFNSKIPVDAWNKGPGWTLGDAQLEVSEEETHLGLIRVPDDKTTKTVEANIRKARRASYSLMSAGMYGLNGVHPKVGLKLWQTYALPILTFGLEGKRLNLSDIDKLENARDTSFATSCIFRRLLL